MKMRIYIIASNSRHFSIYVVFFMTSKSWLNLKYIMHNYSNMRNKQMVINTCQNLPFFKISQTHACLQNDPFFLISRICASQWKNTPFFAKMGTSVVYVWSGGCGGTSHEKCTFCTLLCSVVVIYRPILPTLFMVTSLGLGQSYFPNASEATLKNMGK